MRINGLFWNLGGANRAHLVAEAAAERHLDIVVLAEPGHETTDCLSALSETTGANFHCPPSLTTRLQVYCRSSKLDLSEIYVDNNKRLTIRRMLWDRREFLLVAVHLISKLRWREADQHAEAQVLAEEIRKEEDKRGHRRTILVGDLNMNPFEAGVVQANCIHGMMCKEDLRHKSRTVQKRRYPEALEHFDDQVQLVDQIGHRSLLTARQRPDKEIGSDHLPLYFSLNASPSISR